LVASSTLSTLSVSVVGAGVVGEAAVSVATELVASPNDCVVGWGEGEGGFDNVDWASEAGSDWTMSKPRELGGGSELAMPDDVGRRGQELEGRSDYGVKRASESKSMAKTPARHDEWINRRR
jgi:hypothetical protein